MITASEQLTRLLAVIPWVVGRGGASLTEIRERFGYGTDADVVADLELLWVCGVPPYSPDTLMEAWIDDDWVEINLAHWFRRPLRLGPAEGVALLAAGEAVLATRGADRSGALATGLAKLRAALGPAAQQVHVELVAGPPGLLDTLRGAISAGKTVEIEYLSLGRNELTARTIVPWRVLLRDGVWYMGAWCTRANEPRTFRLDRVRSYQLGSSAEVGWPPDEAWFGDDWALREWFSSAGEADVVATVCVAPEAEWIADAYPNLGREVAKHGLVVRFRVVDPDWLVSLLIRLGPAARTYSWTAAESLPAAVHETARRIAARY